MIKSINIEKKTLRFLPVLFDVTRPLLKVFESEFNTKALFKRSLKGDDNYNTIMHYHRLLATIIKCHVIWTC